MQIAPPRQLLVRLTGGLLAGFVLWAVGGPFYNPLVTSVAGWAIRTSEDPGVTRVVWNDGAAVVNRDDFPANSPRPSIPVGDETYDIILLTVLFAAAPKPLSDRNIPRFLIAACCLFPIHVFALVAEVESIYALHLGRWSTVHYGPWARNFWATSAHFYDVIGVHAAAFALWLVFSPRPLPEDEAKPARPAKPSKKKRR